MTFKNFLSKKILPVFFKVLTLNWKPFRLSWKNDQLYVDDSSMALFEDEITSYPASSPEGKGFLGKMLIFVGVFLMIFSIILTALSFYLVPNTPGELGELGWIISGVFFTILGLIIFLFGLKLKIQSKRYFMSLAEKTMPVNNGSPLSEADAADMAIRNAMYNYSVLPENHDASLAKNENIDASLSENQNIALADNNYDDDENDSSEMKQRELYHE